MPLRRVQPTSRTLPGGALETTFQLDNATPRTPPAPRRCTRTRQPVGDDNTGADPSPMRTRRRRYQEEPTPVGERDAVLTRQQESASNDPASSFRQTPQQTAARTRGAQVPVASGSQNVDSSAPGMDTYNCQVLGLTTRSYSYTCRAPPRLV
ncbi:hypothetical protein C8J57DRAFT_1245083 [Mycena rebaudengoi]|nr:hypothetical protein C8J57DRAFT_1245083 [Mycena rebaudengoi]